MVGYWNDENLIYLFNVQFTNYSTPYNSIIYNCELAQKGPKWWKYIKYTFQKISQTVDIQNFMLNPKMKSKSIETHSKRTFKALFWFFYTLLWVFWYKNTQIFYSILRILCWIQKSYIKNLKRTLKALLKHSYYK